jgi:hypothetical protein
MSLKDRELVGLKEEQTSLKAKVEGIEANNDRIKRECFK